jgi:hypothetical protein
MLSPKNHIRGKCVRSAAGAGLAYVAVQPNKKAGVEPAFSHSMRAVRGQYLAMTGPPNL